MSTTKKRISSPHVPEPPPQTWSNCLVVGNQVFVAGMIARDGDKVLGGDSMYEQAKVIFGKIKHLMEAAGGRMDDIVKVQIFVTDIKRREEVWRARREAFTGDFPVSTLVEVRALAAPEILVEVEAVAILGAGPLFIGGGLDGPSELPQRPTLPGRSRRSKRAQDATMTHRRARRDDETDHRSAPRGDVRGSCHFS